jgi:hypothetical protein
LISFSVCVVFLTVLEGRLGEVMRTCLVSVEDTDEAEDTTALSSTSSLLEDSPAIRFKKD